MAAMITLLLAVPFLFSIQPSSAPAGGDAVPIVVQGRGFVPDDQVRWNGQARQTVYVSSRELRARLRPSDLIAAEPGFVTVYDPATGAGSAAARFEIVAPPRQDPAQARQFLLAPPMSPAAPSAAAAVYQPQRAAQASEHPVERPRVQGKSSL
jgi:hypothetical protein